MSKKYRYDKTLRTLVEISEAKPDVVEQLPPSPYLQSFLELMELMEQLQKYPYGKES